jgi:ribonucleoside-diphosphate reductase alpha chain
VGLEVLATLADKEGGMFIDAFQEKVWKDKYQYNDETYEQFCNRIADNIFPDDKMRHYRLIKFLTEFRGLFGGRINSNIGIPEQGLTLFNCFIESIVKNPDSLEGIMEMATKYAITLKTEGGVGFCADFLRPARTLIRKIGVTTPGSVKFLEIFDKVSEVITSGSVDKDDSYQGIPSKNSIRKGATMVTMTINHPDIEEFITAKSIPNKLTKMNMSVLVTDAFMYAVDNDMDWDLWFPDINFKHYDEEWTGDFVTWAEKGYPTVVYKTLRARELWELLLKNTYNRNEPGIIFIDNVRRMDNLHYLKGCAITATNPCGEVPGNTGLAMYEGKLLELGDVCDLGSINLTKYYFVDENRFCVEEFNKDVDLMVRALDNVIEVSNYPLPMYENAAKLKRKIGVGLMGVASLMMMAGLRYGSEECIDLLEVILKEFINQAYKTSALLAKEKGPFPLWDFKALEGGFLKNGGVLQPKTLELVKKHGLRNSAVAAIAPNGTLSIVAGNISGGLEPVFAKEFTRWNRVEGKKVDFKYPNVHKGEWFETDYLREERVADDVVLMGKDKEYRVDKNNGLCRKVLIQDYGYKVGVEAGKTEFGCATELGVDEHLAVLKVFSKYIDQSCSKTINLPADQSFDKFKELYGNLHNYGIKGCTTYRAGTSVAVLETQKKEKAKSIKAQQKEFLDVFKEQENGDIIAHDIKLPEEYPAKGFILKSDGKKWYVHVAFKDKACTKPFAMFVNTNNREDNVLTFNALEKLEEIAIHKGLNPEFIDETKRKYGYQKNPVKICRMLGLLLRHNVDVYTIVMGLDELEASPGTFVFRIKKFLSQFITKIHDPTQCPECGEKAVVFEGGCFECKNCAHTKC